MNQNSNVFDQKVILISRYRIWNDQYMIDTISNSVSSSMFFLSDTIFLPNTIIPTYLWSPVL